MQPSDIPGLPAPVYDVRAAAAEPGKARLVAAVAMLVMGKEAGDDDAGRMRGILGALAIDRGFLVFEF